MARRSSPKPLVPEPGAAASGKKKAAVAAAAAGPRPAPAPATGGAATSTAKMEKGECTTGSYKDLVKKFGSGDKLTPHHIPSDKFMKAQGISGYSHGKGICIMMEQPKEGGGRHRDTLTYGKGSDMSLTPQQALAVEVEDCRQIYKDAGLYDAQVEARLQEVIQKNKEAWPGKFD